MARVEIPTKVCEACGAKMYMAIGPNDRVIPLVKVRAFYVRMPGESEPRVVKATIFDSTEKYVSHFETCTEPGRFSSKKAAG